mgnify:CR=1 FL=1
MNEHRAITLRSNRFLGSALVDKGLVVVTDLEAANEKFMAAMQSENPQHASILTVLLNELKVLDENALIQHLYDEYDLGLVDLDFIKPSSLRPMNVDLSLCWATSTLPFDKVEDTYMIATCYYLSAPVIKHWEELLEGRVLWYATSSVSMSRALGRVREIHEAEDEAIAEEDA